MGLTRQSKDQRVLRLELENRVKDLMLKMIGQHVTEMSDFSDWKMEDSQS